MRLTRPAKVNVAGQVTFTHSEVTARLPFWRTRTRGIVNAGKQAQATVNCPFNNARGVRYPLSERDLDTSVMVLTKGQAIGNEEKLGSGGPQSELHQSDCP